MLKITQACWSLGSHNQGTEDAPQRILQDSLQAGLAQNKIEFSVLEPITVAPTSEVITQKLRNHKAVTELNLQLYEQIMSTAKPEDIVLSLGGDHSISIGSMFASKARDAKTCLVYIDAHPDCNSPLNTPTGNIHGMPLSTVLGDALYTDYSKSKYGYDEVFLIGIKDADAAELEYLSQNKITYYTIDDVIRRGVAEILDEVRLKLDGRPVHVSLDIDCVDCSEAPGTGIINKGGLTYREISYLSRHLAGEKIIALDCVEVNPSRDIDGKTVSLAGDLIVSLLGGKWSPYAQYIHNNLPG